MTYNYKKHMQNIYKQILQNNKFNIFIKKFETNLQKQMWK
jgi:hypothetical protein